VPCAPTSYPPTRKPTVVRQEGPCKHSRCGWGRSSGLSCGRLCRASSRSGGNVGDRQLKTLLMMLICALVCATGCIGGTRVILVPPGRPVQIRETMHRVPVWVRDAEGKRVPGEVDLPAGWWAICDEGDLK
jgi:hypothetical protein